MMGPMGGPGRSAEELWTAAVAALERGRRTEAVRLLRTCADTDDDDHAARAGAMLADLAAARGDAPAAERLARAAVERGTGEGRDAAALSLGNALVLRGETDGAASVFLEVMASGRTASAALAAYNFGVVLTGRGDAEGARSAFAVAIGRGDGELAARAEVNLGGLLASLGDVAGARAAFASAASRGDAGQAAKARLNLMVLRQRYDEAFGGPAERRPGESRGRRSGESQVNADWSGESETDGQRLGELQVEAARLLLASARHPRDPVRQLDLYVSLLEIVDRVAALAETPDELSHAVEAGRGAVRIGELLAKRFPQDPAHHGLGIDAALRLGDLYRARGAPKDASKWYTRAYRAAVRLTGSAPASAAGPIAAARACRQLADVEPARRARAALTEATRFIHMAAEREPAHLDLPFQRSLTLWRLGAADPEEAPAAAAQIIGDLSEIDGTLAVEAAEALAWARTVQNRQEGRPGA
jgi:hypothetical protein